MLQLERKFGARRNRNDGYSKNAACQQQQQNKSSNRHREAAAAAAGWVIEDWRIIHEALGADNSCDSQVFAPVSAQN